MTISRSFLWWTLCFLSTSWTGFGKIVPRFIGALVRLSESILHEIYFFWIIHVNISIENQIRKYFYISYLKETTIFYNKSSHSIFISLHFILKYCFIIENFYGETSDKLKDRIKKILIALNVTDCVMENRLMSLHYS